MAKIISRWWPIILCVISSWVIAAWIAVFGRLSITNWEQVNICTRRQFTWWWAFVNSQVSSVGYRISHCFWGCLSFRRITPNLDWTCTLPRCTQILKIHSQTTIMCSPYKGVFLVPHSVFFALCGRPLFLGYRSGPCLPILNDGLIVSLFYLKTSHSCLCCIFSIHWAFKRDLLICWFHSFCLFVCFLISRTSILSPYLTTTASRAILFTLHLCIFRLHGRNIYPLSGPREFLLFLYLAHHWQAFLGDLLQPHLSLWWTGTGVEHNDLRLLGHSVFPNSSVACAEPYLIWVLSSTGAWWCFGGWLPGVYLTEPLVGHNLSAATLLPTQVLLGLGIIFSTFEKENP